MENYEQELALERGHYAEIAELLRRRIAAAESESGKRRAELSKVNREMWEDASHSALDFDRVESLSQYYMPLGAGLRESGASSDRLRTLRMLAKSAYFARIDFLFDDETEFEKIYIGRAMLMDDEQRKIHIYDWRAPISSLFYRFETGKAFYESPNGRVSGDIGLKRQYEIKKGVFEYFFDADVQIADEFLRKMLSGNTSSKMKTIVETIQKDQDIAIRDMDHDLLMIQGIAGSGKTSIALHRVAYLKYQGLSGRLNSDNIMVLSPNTMFEQYISNVLPELGEEDVKSAVFDELIAKGLQGRAFQSRYDQTEFLISCGDAETKAAVKRAIEYKTSGGYAEKLRRYASRLTASHVAFTDIVYNGETVFSAADLKRLTDEMPESLSLAVRLRRLRTMIFNKIHERRKTRIQDLRQTAKNDPEHVLDWEEFARAQSIEESTRLALEADKFTRLDFVTLYREMAGIHDTELRNEDALAAFYLGLLTGACEAYKTIRQVVVDEAQDYYGMHFELLKLLFPNAKYTVLGDINQTIEKRETMTLYDSIRDILRPDNCALMTMGKSFRCTKEILAFSMRFLKCEAVFESFNRSGAEPCVIQAESREGLLAELVKEAENSKNLGCGSIGIICKDAGEAETLYRDLKGLTDVRLVRAGGSLDTSGLFVIPITMSKGLEFDSVLIYGTDEARYCTEDDRKLLYIASTRALHRLNLFYTGRISPLINLSLEGGGI